MPAISSVTTAVPVHSLETSATKAFGREHFSGKLAGLDGLLSIYDNTGVKRRYFTQPVSWYSKSHPLSEKNQLYIEHATSLSLECIENLLSKSQLTPLDIDYFIYVNSTGLATPSIDARLINLLGMKSDIRRTPIWGLGCAGGASGLATSYHYALGHPGQRVLLVAAELCALTFIPGDYSKSNLVASALFADGAAAVLIEGDELVNEENAEDNRLSIIGTNSRFFPDSLDVMGWNVVDQGLQVVFAKRIPDIVRKHTHQDISAFLKEHDLQLSDISHFLIHPGGKKVLEAYQSALGLSDQHLTFSRQIMSEYGNMSSVTVLFVLERFMQERGLNQGEYAIVSALGPGFSSESLLLRG